jgi:hypothetical protein
MNSNPENLPQQVENQDWTIQDVVGRSEAWVDGDKNSPPLTLRQQAFRALWSSLPTEECVQVFGYRPMTRDDFLKTPDQKAQQQRQWLENVRKQYGAAFEKIYCEMLKNQPKGSG